MITKKPSLKAIVSSIDEGQVHFSIDNEKISFSKEFFSELPQIGDEIFITLQKHEDYKKHHEHLSKTILNKIFSKTP